MQSIRLHASTLLFLGILPAALFAQADLDLGPITERHEMIPMRDGQRLSAYLYFPAGSGPWPAVFEQRYANLRAAGTRKAAAKLAEAGYIVTLVNFRGTHLSEGTWVGYRALGWGELKDGYDTCEWLAKQSWCSGNVGTFGGSQGGYAQNFLAVTQPPHLKCQYMVDTGLSLFQEGYRIGGVTRPNRFLAMAANCRNPDDNRKLLEEWFRHPNYDDYWRQEDCSLHFDKMNVPCFTIGSWYDFMCQGSVASFIGRQHHGGPNSRGKQQLLIGPWLHGRLNKTNKVGDLVYPENAIWPEHEHMVRWFDHYLKGKDNGVEREPAVRYYVMGAAGEPDAPGNYWWSTGDFAPADGAVEYYLQPEGRLGEAPTSDQGSTTYISDPLHPMQILGTAFPGAKDARAFETQPEVRTFTSTVLEGPVEWTGKVRAELFVSSTARDTDFLVRVSDVYPDGASILLMDYPRRARYRDGFDQEALLEPGKVYELKFDVGWISHIFNHGHRIRVTIASTGAPLYEPNPQTGGPQTIEMPANAVKAENTIYHNRTYASRIVAPTAWLLPPNGPKEHAYIYPGEVKGTSAAVVVGDWPLVHTSQLLPTDRAGQALHPGDAAAQLNHLLDQLQLTVGGDLDRVVKLNFYIASEEARAAVFQTLASRFEGPGLPAVSLVCTALPARDALVAVDAVALAPAGVFHVSPVARAAIMPAGSRLYVSGQAERAESLREATRKTLDSLMTTLKHCGRGQKDIVQLKCFFQPMSSVAEVQDEINDYFGTWPGVVVPARLHPGQPPSTSFVEWKAPSPSIEIELVAWGGPANNYAKEALEFITPPGMTKSPLYSRIARIHRGSTIFFGDLFGPAGASAEEQAKAPFDQLAQLFKLAGSDFKHLVKATYYVTDDEISKAHNAIRPKYYDPARPPAASKVLIHSTGHGSRYVMDMIAVPVR